MEIRDPKLHCLGCNKVLPMAWWTPDVDEPAKAALEAQCHDCKALYRLRVATYRKAEQ